MAGFDVSKQETLVPLRLGTLYSIGSQDQASIPPWLCTDKSRWPKARMNTQELEWDL